MDSTLKQMTLPFVDVRYTADIPATADGTDLLCAYVRVASQALTLTINGSANAPIEGSAVNSVVPIRVTSTRKYGIVARHIVIERIGGTTDTPIRVRRTVPIFNPATLHVTITEVAASISYQGHDDWTVIGAKNEIYNLNFAS